MSIKKEKKDFKSYFNEQITKMHKILNINNKNYMSKVEDIKSINQNQIEKIDKTINNLTLGLNKILSDIRIELEDVKKIANEKEERIRQYEDGYNYKILKNFIKELIRIADYSSKNKEKDIIIEEIYDDLMILLENEGVEEIMIVEGDKYSGNEKNAKIIDTEFTNDKEKNNTIKEIIKNGYRVCITEDKYKIIRPAEVVIYKYKDINQGISDTNTEITTNNLTDKLSDTKDKNMNINSTINKTGNIK